MEIIAVRPCYRRRGLGSLLMEEGLNFAEAIDEKFNVEASPLGLHLYKRFGFKPVAKITIDLRDFGGDGVISDVCMTKEAAAKSSRMIAEE